MPPSPCGRADTARSGAASASVRMRIFARQVLQRSSRSLTSASGALAARRHVSTGGRSTSNSLCSAPGQYRNHTAPRSPQRQYARTHTHQRDHHSSANAQPWTELLHISTGIERIRTGTERRKRRWIGQKRPRSKAAIGCRVWRCATRSATSSAVPAAMVKPRCWCPIA
jgi:hypothetical protein